MWVIAPSYCADVIGASPLSSLRPSCTVQRFPSHLSSAAAAAAFKCGWENSFQRRRGCGKKSAAAAAGENRVQQGGRGGLGGRTDLGVVDQTSIRVRTYFISPLNSYFNWGECQSGRDNIVGKSNVFFASNAAQHLHKWIFASGTLCRQTDAKRKVHT